MRLTKISDRTELLEHHLKDLYSAETQIVDALPDMIEKISSSTLAASLQSHLSETEIHVKRLEEVADALEFGDLSGVKCKGMEGLLDEGDEAISNIEEGDLLDNDLAAGSRKVEHYEILAYQHVIRLMNQIGCDTKIISMLEETLNEEMAADGKLSNFLA